MNCRQAIGGQPADAAAIANGRRTSDVVHNGATGKWVINNCRLRIVRTPRCIPALHPWMPMPQWTCISLCSWIWKSTFCSNGRRVRSQSNERVHCTAVVPLPLLGASSTDYGNIFCYLFIIRLYHWPVRECTACSVQSHFASPITCA